MIAAAIKGAATGQAGRGTPQRPGAREFPPAMRTAITIAARQAADGEGELMAARFPRDPEIGAGTPPIRSVRGEAAAAGAKLGQEMGQLVAQGAIDLGRAVGGQARIQKHPTAGKFGPAGGGTQAPRPFHLHASGQGDGGIRD